MHAARMRLVLTVLALPALTGCALLPAAPPAEAPSYTPPPATDRPSPTQSALPPTCTSTPLPTSTVTLTPLPTHTPSLTPLPAGMGLVPDVVGQHYLDAREVLFNAGFPVLIRDVFDLEAPFGMVLQQDPLPGAAAPLGEVVFLVRAFQTAGMPVSDACQVLRPTQLEGYLMYAVYLDGGFDYEVATDFSQGETVIFDQNMTVLAWFDNPNTAGDTFVPEWSGYYVLRMGPYHISRDRLAEYTAGTRSHCLYVRLPE